MSIELREWLYALLGREEPWPNGHTVGHHLTAPVEDEFPLGAERPHWQEAANARP